MKYQKNSPAFTLIELLVVISIIGVLSTMIISTTKDIMFKAQISKVATDLRTIEKAFNMLNYLETGCWPKERSSQASTYCSFALTASTANPTLAQAISSTTTNFSDYLSKAPTFPISSGQPNYRYDNDLDTYVQQGCNSNGGDRTGVNIIINHTGSNTLLKTFHALNDIFDPHEKGASLYIRTRCGKIRNPDSNIKFMLSPTP